MKKFILLLVIIFSFQTSFSQEKIKIGQQAPEITWSDYNKPDTHSLYNLKECEYYIIAFWSSTCGHCLEEIPKLNIFVNNESNIKTLAIGLETEESKINWIEETYFYENLTHILAIKKFQSKFAIDYDVTSTPAYFVLNSDKEVIFKTNKFNELSKSFK